MEVKEHLDNQNISSEENLLPSVDNIIDPVENTMGKFGKETPSLLIDFALNGSLEDTGVKIGENRKVFQSLVMPSDDTGQMSAFRFKYEKLYAKLQNQTIELEKAYDEIERLKNQILNQSTYCTSLGAALGNLAWRASTFPRIIDVWLSGFQNKIGEFLAIANGTFVAFINTYGTDFPPVSNVEFKFIVGLLSIVTNISASPQGRQFLLTHPSGKDFIQRVVKLMPNVPSSAGSVSLKRLMLMILYNISINKTGLQYLFELRLGHALSYCLQENSLSEKLQLLSLRVLRSISYNLIEPKYIQDLITTVPIEKIGNMALSENSEISAMAKEVMKQLQDSKKYSNIN